MDGGQVNIAPMTKGGVEKAPAPLSPYSDLFRKAFPFYLSIGMSYEQYWLGEIELVKYYRQAHAIKQDINNQNAWLQGMYFYEALCDASPLFRTNFKKGKVKPLPYSDKPYPLNKSEKKSKSNNTSNDASIAYMQAFMKKNNKKFQRKGERNDR